MSIVGMNDILNRALQRGYIVGYFEAWDQYSLEAAMEAAEESNSPTILGFGAAVTNPTWMDGRGLEELAGLTQVLAKSSSVPTAVLFNEANTLAQVAKALQTGCNAVMMHTSHLPYEENVAVTKEVVDVAHALGATVEGELGHLADASSPGEVYKPTDPAKAADFVKATGVDVLAVSIGNIHLHTEGEAPVSLDLLEKIHQAVSVPLVLHGGTSIPGWAIKPVTQRGVAKINYGTRLKQAFLAGLQEALTCLPEKINVHHLIGSREASDILGCGKAEMKKLICELTHLYGCAGQATHW